MPYIPRKIEQKVSNVLARGKSILLLGARQTGKTTFIKNQCHYDIYYSFARPKVRQRFEEDPERLITEVLAEKALASTKKPLVVAIDEVQKIPPIMDAVQFLIDEEGIQFILTGSSARKLKRGDEINLLPGRVIKIEHDALSLLEMPTPLPTIKDLLLFGSLPEILLLKSPEEKEESLESYVSTYLEEEIRMEALVRNIGNFSKFLNLAAVELGRPINFSKLSQDVGVSRATISEYYQILEDCLLIDKIDPISNSHSRRRLVKASKYVFYDLGVRRLAAHEGLRLPETIFGHLFEQFVGAELVRYCRLLNPSYEIKYWSEHAGAEVDYIVDMNKNKKYLPIEVKWTTKPDAKDYRNLLKFQGEYECTDYAYIICQTPKKQLLHDRILALPWQELPLIAEQMS